MHQFYLYLYVSYIYKICIQTYINMIIFPVDKAFVVKVTIHLTVLTIHCWLG